MNRKQAHTDDDAAAREYIALLRKSHPSPSLRRALDELEAELDVGAPVGPGAGGQTREPVAV